jgi:hypothetical protein
MAFILESIFSALSLLAELSLWLGSNDKPHKHNRKGVCLPCRDIKKFSVVKTDQQLTGVIRALRKNLSVGAYREIPSFQKDQQPPFLMVIDLCRLAWRMEL